MPGPILPISTIAIPPTIAPAATSTAGTSSSSFKDVFTSAIQNVQTAQQNASDSVQRFLSGDNEELHTTVLATQRAELAFDMFQQVRNKVVSAYQEIMKMQI